MERKQALFLILALPGAIYGYIPPDYHEKARKWWRGADTYQHSRVLYYAETFSISLGAKCVLESAGGILLDHGEDSHGEIGIHLPTARLYQPGITADMLNDPEIAGRIGMKIDQHNLDRFRHKVRPELDAAMAWVAYTDWRSHLPRGLYDLALQELIRDALNGL